MVAKLSEGTSLRQVFYYNQNKEKEGEATCLLAENYPFEAAELSESSRLKLLEKMAALRPSVATNALHISVNFDASENLSDNQFRAIARDYMTGIGFGEQPYLVYRHHDAGHPHMHIVTTNIRIDGSFIPLHKLAMRKSEPTRKAIELKYGLVIAGQQNSRSYQLESAFAKKITYGRKESKKAIAVVLNAVIGSYKYGSLAELNAVLGLYNVKADSGKPGSNLHKHGGLIYRILGQDGQPMGIPIKSSSFYNKPTLKSLEARFATGKKSKKLLASRLKNAIDLHLTGHERTSLQGFISAMEREGIAVVFRKSEQGETYGVTYIDHRSKTVFNGSELGKEYAVKALLERIVRPEPRPLLPVVGPKLRPQEDDQYISMPSYFGPEASEVSAELLENLLAYELAYQSMPAELRGKKKRKKRKKRT